MFKLSQGSREVVVVVELYFLSLSLLADQTPFHGRADRHTSTILPSSSLFILKLVGYTVHCYTLLLWYICGGIACTHCQARKHTSRVYCTKYT